MATKLSYADLPPAQQAQARAMFLNAGRGDGCLYEIDSDARVLCRAPLSYLDVGLYARNYRRLLRLLGEDPARWPAHAHSESSGYMRLSFDLLDRRPDHFVIALAHYFEQNGDLVPDPDMQVLVDFAHKAATALTFQDARNYCFAHDGDGNPIEKAAEPMNRFLAHWLDNLARQGHSLRGAS